MDQGGPVYLDVEEHSTEDSAFLVNRSSSSDELADPSHGLFSNRIRYYIPSLKWIPEYNFQQCFSNDLIAGLSVAFILIPQSLSYAQALVKIPPIHGLYTAFASLIVYSLLGMSRQLAVGPEALVAILTGSAVSSYIKTRQLETAALLTSFDPVVESINAATTISFLVGSITFLLGFFRLGFLDSVLSRALLRGFISAVAIVVMIDLSDSLLGFSMSLGAASPFQHFLALVSRLPDTNIPSMILSCGAITFLSSMRLLKRTYAQIFPKIRLLPEVLFLVILSTTLARHFDWPSLGIQILRDATPAYPSVSLPSLSIARINIFLLPSILISLIGFVESIAVAKTYANKCGYSISPNRELVALGGANIAVSIFGGWPAFGSLGRSSLNYAASRLLIKALIIDAKTQLAGFITGIAILLVMVFFLPLFYFLPRAVQF